MKFDSVQDLNVSPRILLGPGPSSVSPRVLKAMSTPLIGHLDPEFIIIMNEIQEMLRHVFQTKNNLTIPVSGTGSAGMEAALCNFIEPGDNVLIAVNGYFGERLIDMASRYGANIDRIDVPWGEIFSVDKIDKALSKKKYKILGLVHAETSTGAKQLEIKEISSKAHKHGALVVLDTVTSLGGMSVEIDAWGVDIAYSGTQKALSCPPGLAPLTIGENALEVLKNRKSKVANWYLDLSLVERYWGEARTYHHTAPISMIYGLRESLRLVMEEGLKNRFDRHSRNANLLWEGLESLGFDLLVPKEYRLTTLTTPLLGSSVEDELVRKLLLSEYNIEIAGGFGPLAGKTWRIGLMGFSSKKENATLLISAISNILNTL